MVALGSRPAIAASSDNLGCNPPEVVPEALVPIVHPGVFWLSGPEASPVVFPFGDFADDFRVEDSEFGTGTADDLLLGLIVLVQERRRSRSGPLRF